MNSARGRSRSARVAALAVLAVAALTAIAFAAAPVKGAKYSGHLAGASASTTVSFHVSASGKRVVGVRVKPAIPSKCGGGGPPPPETSEPAKISRRGRFTAKVEEQLINGVGRATVSGRFLSGGREKGAIRYFPRPGEPASCTGYLRYTTSTK